MNAESGPPERPARPAYWVVQTFGSPSETLISPKVMFFLNLLRAYGSSTISLVPSWCSSSTRTASDPLARTSATNAAARVAVE